MGWWLLNYIILGLSEKDLMRQLSSKKLKMLKLRSSCDNLKKGGKKQ